MDSWLLEVTAKSLMRRVDEYAKKMGYTTDDITKKGHGKMDDVQAAKEALLKQLAERSLTERQVDAMILRYPAMAQAVFQLIREKAIKTDGTTFELVSVDNRGGA